MAKAPRGTSMAEYEAIIRTAMARTLWVTSYADYAEQNSDDRSIRRARGGQDWDDVAGPTPKMAKNAADALVERFTKSEPMIPYEYEMANLFDMARTADDGETWEWPTNPARNVVESLKEFGHYMVMQSLGHGVSWFDDHKEFGLKFPRFECGYDGSDLWWSGMAMGNPAKKCSRDHAAIKKDTAEWNKLKFVGVQPDVDDEGNSAPLELRDCTCGSTLSRLASPKANPGSPATKATVAIISADRTRDPERMAADLSADIDRTFKVTTTRETVYPLYRVYVQASSRTVAKIRGYAVSWLAADGVASTRPNPREQRR